MFSKLGKVKKIKMASMPMKKEGAIRACGEVYDHIKDNRNASVTHITIIRPHR